MARSFVPLLMQEGMKTMVNLNSVAAHNLRPNASAYGYSKAAVLRLTEFLMVELATKGLLAYSVYPGGIMTQLAEAMPKSTHAGKSDLFPKLE
jgi:NAD(P)-dependent dehydrogenase (short-subunit alcohol dehydrogenase family)